MWGVFVKLVRQYLPFLTPNSALLFIVMWGSLPVVLLCACGDAEAKGVLGGLTRFVTLTAPATLRSTIRYTRVGAYLWDGVGHTLYWFAFRPHPTSTEQRLHCASPLIRGPSVHRGALP